MNVEKAQRAARARARVVPVEQTEQRRATVFEAVDPRWTRGAPNPYMRRETDR